MVIDGDNPKCWNVSIRQTDEHKYVYCDNKKKINYDDWGETIGWIQEKNTKSSKICVML